MAGPKTTADVATDAEERERVLEALGQRAKGGGDRRGCVKSDPATVAGSQTTADIAGEAGMSERVLEAMGQRAKAEHGARFRDGPPATVAGGKTKSKGRSPEGPRPYLSSKALHPEKDTIALRRH